MNEKSLFITIFTISLGFLSCQKQNDSLKKANDTEIVLNYADISPLLIGENIYISLYNLSSSTPKITSSKVKSLTGVATIDTCKFRVKQKSSYRVYVNNKSDILHDNFANKNPLTYKYSVSPSVPGYPDVIRGADQNIIAGQSSDIFMDANLKQASVNIKSRLCSLRVVVKNVKFLVNQLYFYSEKKVAPYIFPDQNVTYPTSDLKSLYKVFSVTESFLDNNTHQVDIMFVPPQNNKLTFSIYNKILNLADTPLKTVKNYTFQRGKIYSFEYTVKYGIGVLRYFNDTPMEIELVEVKQEDML